MGVDHRADAVFELRDHLAAAVVGGGIGGKQNQHIDVEFDRIAADLHVPLFQDVEQADLHQLVQLGQLVHGKDAPVHARNQTEVERFLGRHARAAGQLGRIDFADHVGELRSRRQPLGVAIFALPPGDRHLFRGGWPELLARASAAGRIVVYRRVGQVQIGNFGVEKSGESRISRLLACPFSPKNNMSCRANSAMLISGITVLS